MAAPSVTPAGPRRERRRRQPNHLRSKENRAAIANRVTDFYYEDRSARENDRTARLQRYAKYRQWTSGRNYPWEDASDVAIPDSMAHSQATQDALFNAATAVRPPIVAKADEDPRGTRARTIDQILDTQFFEECDGEQLIADAVDCFVNDGVVTWYIPWIREHRDVQEVRVLDGLKREDIPGEVFFGYVQSEWPSSHYNHFRTGDEDGWDYRVEPKRGTDDTEKTVSFYTRADGKVEMLYRHEIKVHDGPGPRILRYEDVEYPPESANLQMPSPSNPGGAAHVIVRERITLDEIRRYQKSGFFDLLSKDDLDSLESVRETSNENEEAEQKRVIQGRESEETILSPEQGHLTLLRCFDLYDIDDDGMAEDVVFWVILETKQLCKAKRLSELYPFNPPLRPFAEASFLPVPKFREGISLLEIIEGMHDLRKELLDMGLDASMLTNAPWGFYKPNSALNPEVLRLAPGELYPATDPQRDVNVLNLNSGNTHAFTFNGLSWVAQQEEKLTLVGDVQQGRVPAGQASALRTSGGIAQLIAAGSARPERILRRFFKSLRDAYRLMHMLNRAFLPEGKKFLLVGVKPSESDVYVTKRRDLEGEFRFKFMANVGTSSRNAMEETLSKAMAVLFSELNIQLGIVSRESAYELQRDYISSLGVDPERYMTEPTPEAKFVRIVAEEALTQIIQGNYPIGIPREDPQEHLQRLIEFRQDQEKMALLPQDAVEILTEYAAQVSQLVQQQQQQQATAQQAAALGQRVAPQGTPGPEAGPVPPGQQRFQENELIDETLPSNGVTPQ